VHTKFCPGILNRRDLQVVYVAVDRKIISKFIPEKYGTNFIELA
jgi:hypothetical protein